MVNPVQTSQLLGQYQQSSSVSQRNNQQPSANLPQDTVNISDKAKDAQASLAGNAGKASGLGDVDHDGDSH